MQSTGSWGAGLRRRFGEHAVPIVAAVVVNVLLLFGAGLFVVVRVLRMPEAEFAAAVQFEVPSDPWEQELETGDLEAGAASAESPIERLATELALPGGPVVPMVNDTARDAPSSDLLSGVAQGMLSDTGFGGMLAGARTAGSAASFFGIDDSGERIVIIVNTSASLMRKAARRGVTIERIHEEVLRLVDGLAPASLFGIVQFSQGVRLFAPDLAPASPANKETLRRWISAGLRGNPALPPEARLSGHEAAIEAALKLEPDVVFLVTDGQLDRRDGSPGAWTYPVVSYEEFSRTLRAVRARHPARPRLHVIGFELNERDTAGMRRLAREFGGQVRVF